MRPSVWIISILFSFGLRAAAQEADAYKFAPPPPPPLDDYEELDDEGFETDEAFRPPPPPLPPGGQNNGAPPPPPPPDFKATNEAYISQPGKFRFRLVEGEYWEKGKKRSRGRQMYGRSGN
jgi:hypothetical protein